MPRLDTEGAVGAALATTAETVVALLSGVNTPASGQVSLIGAATISTGAGTTAIVGRIRRGTTVSGPVVGNPVTVPATAGANGEVIVEVVDAPGEVAGQSYCLTVAQTAATANGSTVQSHLRADY